MSKEIQLTQGKTTLVDDEDFEWLNHHKWHASNHYHTWYAERNNSLKNGKRKRIRMHREILRPPCEMQTDHKDGNGLNNQRENLRMATKAQNQHNRRKGKGTSQYKGVCWNRQRAKWQAYITVEGKLLHLGRFDSEIEAAKTYDRAALKYFGEFASTNF